MQGHGIRWQGGFSLLDLILSLLIIGLIMQLSLATYKKVTALSYDQAAIIYIRQLIIALEDSLLIPGADLPLPNTSCSELYGSSPRSIRSCRYTPNYRLNSYSFTVESISGKVFAYAAFSNKGVHEVENIGHYALQDRR